MQVALNSRIATSTNCDYYHEDIDPKKNTSNKLMTAVNLPLEIAEMKLYWLDAMRKGGKMRYLLREMIGQHSERCEIILNKMHGDERVQKAIQKRKGRGLVEENALLNITIELRELQQWGFADGRTNKAKELYGSSFGKAISELEKFGARYSTLTHEWIHYLCELLNCHEEGIQDANRSDKFKIRYQEFNDAWFMKKWGAESELADWQVKQSKTANNSAAMLDIEKAIQGLKQRIKKIDAMREEAELSSLEKD